MAAASATSTATFRILYFASAQSYTKKQTEQLPAPQSVQHLLQTLESLYPGMTAKVLQSSALTINLDYVTLDDDQEAARVIQAGDEVAIIPPVSAG